jgi:hypothetical protein
MLSRASVMSRWGEKTVLARTAPKSVKRDQRLLAIRCLQTDDVHIPDAGVDSAFDKKDPQQVLPSNRASDTFAPP